MQLLNKYSFLTNYFNLVVNSTTHAMPQSIIFYGNDFNAQFALAKEFARLTNCKMTKDINCNCINCRWIKEDSHPAVVIVSKVDHKAEDDNSRTVISIKQATMIKEQLMNDSEFNRVYILCDKDDDNNLQGLNKLNFQADTANSMLKIIEEPQSGVTFIFLTRYIDNLLPTIVSRSQCFFVPSFQERIDEYNLIKDSFENYWNFNRINVFDISQNLVKLSATHGINKILDNIQNYIFSVLKSNTKNEIFIEHIKAVEEAKKQANLGIKPTNIFDNLCLKLIK